MKFSQYVLQSYGVSIDAKIEGFVDVDTFSDVEQFIDPFKIARCNKVICEQMQKRILHFYDEFLSNVRSGNVTPFLEAFHEVKPIRFGYAGDSFNGNGIGLDLASNMISAIRQSRAFQTGRVRDLEDFTFMIENVSYDRLSDLVSNIIYDELIMFTQELCRKYNIPMSSNYYVKGGLTFFDIDTLSVMKFNDELPLDNLGRPFILVPDIISKKGNLSLKGSYDYYSHGIIEHLRRDKDLFKLLTNREYNEKFKKKDVKSIVEEMYATLRPGTVKFANYYLDEFDSDLESVRIYKEFRTKQNSKK
jgi:hypothetical protein